MIERTALCVMTTYDDLLQRAKKEQKITYFFQTACPKTKKKIHNHMAVYICLSFTNIYKCVFFLEFCFNHTQNTGHCQYKFMEQCFTWWSNLVLQQHKLFLHYNLLFWANLIHLQIRTLMQIPYGGHTVHASMNDQFIFRLASSNRNN